ncbi:MAG TPA: amidohydrolase [Gemmatimonadaceae bacterium]|nr:MAG: amidohydrolase [Gemmatimonadetes bacterium SCN 70-22]HMN08154.1 amidohydrolase [Gemmatimonadaceae bacterium]
MRRWLSAVVPSAFVLTALVSAPAALPAQKAPRPDPRLEKLKAEALTKIDARAKLVQEIIDQVFSFGELGMQEFETSKYLTGLLEANGFTVERGVAGMPTAFVATWGSGKPVIALGSDIDGIPQSNQKPAFGFFEPLVPGAPGHGEGHNSGQAVNIAAALVVKEIMEREKIPGTLKIWPGVAEEQVAGKAHLVRAGVFKDVDVALFTHVGNNLGVSWGQSGSNAIVTALFRFKGQTAHSAGAPWRGKSALDAVMLMGQGWEFKREHLEPAQRSHYVIVDGGDQPNVVPQTASIWFYIRERDYDRVQANFEAAKRIAQGAAMMTDTKLDTVMILGSAWSGHFNKAIAQATYDNIKRVGLPRWDENDLALAKAIQKELGSRQQGLETQVDSLGGPVDMSRSLGGGSDDIGDVSWNVPTVTLRYPSNIPGLPGHNWANGISMATPIAHKGGVAGAKVQALTLLDILLTPKLVADAWDYFNNVQTKTTKYKSFLGPNDGPPTWLNEEIMAKYRPLMKPYYYDPSKHSSYLEQLGIKYPTVKPIAQ